MTRRQVWQYWCEHCGKHNLSAGSIRQHEKHCTANPNRECRMCAATRNRQERMADLIACIDVSLPDQGLGALREKSGDCPACILSAIRQCGGHLPAFTLMAYGFSASGVPETDPKFSYKEECRAWWDARNEDAMERDNGYY